MFLIVRWTLADGITPSYNIDLIAKHKQDQSLTLLKTDSIALFKV